MVRCRHDLLAALALGLLLVPLTPWTLGNAGARKSSALVAPPTIRQAPAHGGPRKGAACGNKVDGSDLGAALVSSCAPNGAARQHRMVALPGDGPYLHTDGSLLRDAGGHTVRLSGVNWFGLETCALAPDGLGVRTWWDLLDQVRALGYNVIRLPFSDELLHTTRPPRYINYTLNPDLRGLSGLQIMDRLVRGAGLRGLRIVLDRHRPGCTAQSPLWYTAQYSERRWIADLVSLVRRYRHEPAVIGIDLHNEPHGPATWGDGNLATDWRLAAERAGNAVLRANPHLLIFVQGVQVYHGDNYWWGGNLEGVAAAPVRLAVPHRLVYEAHDYGPGVYWQSYFSAPDFPRNLLGIWRRHWAYLQESGTAPVLLGEFGGRSVSRDTGIPQEAVWQHMLVAFLAQHRDLGFVYWSLTPDSSDTGGLLNDDWQAANSAKQTMLAPIQGAAIPAPRARPAPAALRVLASDVLAPAGTQQSLTVRVVNDGARPLPLAGAEVRYWLDEGVAASQPPTVTGWPRLAAMDWASTGPGSVAAVPGRARGHAYIALRFLVSAMLAPYGGVATIILRLHRADWAPYQPAHDWSYLPSVVPIPLPHLTLVVAGRTVWGESPRASVRPARPHVQGPPPRFARGERAL